jgi:hypothetical protein
MDKYVDTGALLQVLVVSVIGGAGLVAMFAVGLVGTSYASAGTEGQTSSPSRRAAGLSLAAISFILVAAGVVLGIYAMLKKPA